LDIEAFLIKTKLSFRLFEKPLIEIRSAGNDYGSFGLGMQAERNFDCRRELSLQENAADVRRQQTIAKFRFVDPAKDDRRLRKNDP